MAPPAPRLSIAAVDAGDRRVLVVEGDVELATAPELDAAFSEAAATAAPLAVDLSAARTAGAAGTALLVHAVRRLQVRHRTGDVALAGPPPPVRSALQRTGLARRLQILDDPDALGAPVARAREAAERRIAAGGRQRRTTQARRGALLAEATLAVERRHADPMLSLDEIAREIATSSRQLQRVYAELAGSAFRDELAAVRMQHGAALLQTTDLPVAEIARRVGYRQAAQFAKAFRRHHGLPPSAFRSAAP